jgi:hypothetical protein
MQFEKYKRETCGPAISTMKMAPYKGEGRTSVDIDKVFNDLMNEINDSIRAKKPYGFPINITFISLDQLWEEVKNTGLHNILSENSEFVLSVGIYPYPCNINSVWIYLAALS